MKLRTTADLRDAMVKLYEDVEAKRVTHDEARLLINAGKAIIDSLKVEIAAAHLGKQFSAVRFEETGNNVPAHSELRRIT